MTLREDRSAAKRNAEDGTGNVAERTGAAARKGTTKRVEIQEVRIALARFDIEGLTPLILHCKSAYDRAQIAASGETKHKKPKRSPEEQYRDSMEEYLIPGSKDRLQIPFSWFKGMLVNVAGRHADSLSLKVARGAFQIVEEWIPLKHSKPHMRTDMVTVGRGLASPRYRAQVDDWSCSFTVRYNMGLIDERGLAVIVETGGFANGFGDWRPEKAGGRFGQYQLKRHS